MEKVFLDLEFCKINRIYKEERKICRAEVIQIGAVMLDHQNKIIDRFNMLVKPEYSSISQKVAELTGINDSKVSGARNFAQVMDEFLEWIGNKKISIYSWSTEDKRQFQNESRLKEFHDARLDELFAHWIDFQKEFDQLLGVSQQISLSNALAGANINFVGQEHSAVDDAENTARLYILTQDKEKFEKQSAAIVELMQPTPDVTMDMGSLFTEDVLKALAL